MGQKQAFCLEDSEVWGVPLHGAQFYCGYQGITQGWADTYVSTLDCQWVDVTDVPSGSYTLTMTVDPYDRFPERDEHNNGVAVVVELP